MHTAALENEGGSAGVPGEPRTGGDQARFWPGVESGLQGGRGCALDCSPFLPGSHIIVPLEA